MDILWEFSEFFEQFRVHKLYIHDTNLIKFACHTILMLTYKVEINACEIAKPFIFEFIEWSAMMITNEPC